MYRFVWTDKSTDMQAAMKRAETQHILAQVRLLVLLLTSCAPVGLGVSWVDELGVIPDDDVETCVDSVLGPGATSAVDPGLGITFSTDVRSLRPWMVS